MTESQCGDDTPRDCVYRVVLDGEVDLGRREELRAVVMGFRRSSAVDAEVDLSSCTFMDSTGIAALLTLKRTADTRRGTVTLVRPEPIVRRVLQLTHVDGLFKIHD
jgi:anti-anti-sigma factor